MRSTSGPVLERAGDLAALLTNLEAHDVLFVDEIHRLSPVVEEVLYPAMEDFQIDIMIGEGPAARSIKLDLPPFTLIGATTRAGLLTAPLRDRFGIVQRLEFYSPEELTAIVRRSARIMGIPCELDGAQEIARRSRGTPRIANRLLRRVRDYAEVRADGQITRDAAQAAMNMLKVDAEGFDELDRRLLTVIIENFDGGPVGVESLAAALSEDRGTLEDVVEPYLIQQGFLVRTARGRMASAKAWRHLGLTPPPRQPQAADLVRHGRSGCLRRPATFSAGRSASTGKTPMPAGWCITPAICAFWSVPAPNGCVAWAWTRWPSNRPPAWPSWCTGWRSTSSGPPCWTMN